MCARGAGKRAFELPARNSPLEAKDPRRRQCLSETRVWETVHGLYQAARQATPHSIRTSVVRSAMAKEGREKTSRTKPLGFAHAKPSLGEFSPTTYTSTQIHRGTGARVMQASATLLQCSGASSTCRFFFFNGCRSGPVFPNHYSIYKKCIHTYMYRYM